MEKVSEKSTDNQMGEQFKKITVDIENNLDELFTETIQSTIKK